MGFMEDILDRVQRKFNINENGLPSLVSSPTSSAPLPNVPGTLEERYGAYKVNPLENRIREAQNENTRLAMQEVTPKMMEAIIGSVSPVAGYRKALIRALVPLTGGMGAYKYFEAKSKPMDIGPYLMPDEAHVEEHKEFNQKRAEIGLMPVDFKEWEQARYPGSKTNDTSQKDITALISSAAQKYGLDSRILHSLLQQESGLNPDSVNINNREESYGLGQINLKAHPNITKEQALNPQFAIDFAARRLSNMINQYGLYGGIQAYNTPGAVNSPELTSYANSIFQRAGYNPKAIPGYQEAGSPKQDEAPKFKTKNAKFWFNK